MNKPLVLVLLILAGAILANAQSDPNLENGFKPYGTYSGSNIDSINLENGNLMLHIPMPFAYPQRGKVEPSYFLGISSKQWTYTCSGATCWWYPPFAFQDVAPSPAAGGIGVAFDSSLDMAVIRSTQTVVDSVDPGLNSAFEGLKTLNTADGATHGLAGTNPDPTSTFLTTYVTNDVSGYLLLESNPDAMGIPQSLTIRDRDGNLYSLGGWRTMSVHETIKTVPDPNNPGHFGNITTTDSTQVAVVTGVTDPNGVRSPCFAQFGQSCVPRPGAMASG